MSENIKDERTALQIRDEKIAQLEAVVLQLHEDFKAAGHDLHETRTVLQNVTNERNRMCVKMSQIMDEIEGSSDGADDASDHAKLCNRIVGIIQP